MIRVAITGIGILSPLGRGRTAHLEAVRDARSGLRRLERFDPAGFVSQVAGEVPGEAAAALPRDCDRTTGYALIAAAEAMEQSGLASSGLAPERLGVVAGTAMGGMETLEAGYQRMIGEGQSRLHPMTIPRAMYNAPAGALSLAHQARGPSLATVSACASSAHALGTALHWIRAGLADAVLAGGCDAPLTPGVLRGWEALRVLAPAGEDPAAACRPFSADRAGFVLAEGAAFFVLEDEARARRRGAPILGTLAGFGMSSDAGHLTDPSAEGQARAMALALADAGLDPAAVQYVNAHGTGTRANDPTETRAIRRAFGPAADRLAVSSTKAMHGHAMGASGAIETALSLIALNEGIIPATLHLERPDPECDLDYVPLAPREGRVEAFLSSSFAFGGMNAVVAVRTA